MAGASRALAIVRPGQGQAAATTTSTGQNSTTASASNSPRMQEKHIDTSSSADNSSNAATSNKLCKNIAIFGSCKYEGKGCAFSHEVEGKRSAFATPTSSRPSTPSSNLTASSMTFTPSAPAFTPSSARTPMSINTTPNTSLASLAASANVFVPKSAKSAVSTLKTEEAQHLFSKATSDGNTSQEEGQIAEDGEQQEDDDDEEEFDGLNPYAAVQSPASTSGNLPALSSSYHSAHSGRSTGPPASTSSQSATATTAPQSVYDPSTPSFEPSYPVHGQARIPDEGHQGQQEAYGYDAYAGEGHHMHSQGGVDNLYLNGSMPGMELYSQTMHQPLQYHLYHPALPHLTPTHLSPHAHLMQTFFMSPQLREELQRKQEACYPASMLAPNRDLLLNDRYWGLVPLDKNPPNARNETISTRLYGWRSWLWRCTNDRDGKLYAIRRMEGYRLSNPESILLIEKWSHILHPNIVTVREAFTTRAFGDHSVCFVYDYHPLSSSLLEIHLTTPARGQQLPPPIPERVLWSYLVQLSSAVKMVHKAGMAVRCLDPSKIIITGKNRLRINGVGILDVLAYDGGKNTASFQQEDLLSLGKLFLSLACRSLSAIHNIQQSLDMGVSRTYSSEFSNALLYLLSKPNPQRKTIDEFWTIISPHVDDDFRGALDQADLLEGDLMRELENGRLVRLMAKFGFINERPEYDHDPRWAETGDRYIIKLFRDYVFHQIDEHGRPVIDLSHVLTCLNKLDAGVDEQLVLVSRDEQSCLIVSYREIRACLENSFRELAR